MHVWSCFKKEFWKQHFFIVSLIAKFKIWLSQLVLNGMFNYDTTLSFLNILSHIDIMNCRNVMCLKFLKICHVGVKIIYMCVYIYIYIYIYIV